MRKKGLEPPRLSAPDPKSGAATNYATSATRIFIKSDCKINVISLKPQPLFCLLIAPPAKHREMHITTWPGLHVGDEFFQVSGGLIQVSVKFLIPEQQTD